MPSVGSGAYEVRVRDASGAWRTICVAKFANAVYVLHAFKKKTQKTAKADLECLARHARFGSRFGPRPLPKAEAMILKSACVRRIKRGGA
ncbi:type II toxin-antitoxin system RelE/ParE family toxin [Rhodanobacter hydrolyticus]|uniref:Type II toxin-antitoxin system RelE/ParE family toxin n=2 Tax=Rhodanobacter hydrolyticus TaxID=2250595 RepID=A0ABW8J501_9GAMM